VAAMIAENEMHRSVTATAAKEPRSSVIVVYMVLGHYDIFFRVVDR
jgi:hypothetical protein